MGYTPTSVSLLGTRDKFPVNLFLVQLRKVGSFDIIYTLKSFLNLGEEVRYFNFRSGPQQCYWCQRYGHSSAFCHMPTRCVRCSDEHREGCPKPREAPAKSCSWTDTHPANYRGCTIFKKALMVPPASSSEARPAAPATH